MALSSLMPNFSASQIRRPAILLAHSHIAYEILKKVWMELNWFFYAVFLVLRNLKMTSNVELLCMTTVWM